jgi:micrococcal nuclease
MSYTFRLHTLLSVTDGDTLKVFLDLGFATYTQKTVRIAGLDTPESRGTSPLEKQAGSFVRKQVADWLLARESRGLVVVSEEWNGSGDKYGRVLGDVTTNGKTEKGVPALLAPPIESLRAWLINNKLARVYNGGKKLPWTTAELNAVLARPAKELHGK